MEKIFVGESEAKAIVRGFMRQYQCTEGDLILALQNMWAKNKTPTTVSKREMLIQRRFKKYGHGIICKPVQAWFSTKMMFYTQFESSTSSLSISQSQIKQHRKTTKQFNQYVRSIHDQSFHVFITRSPDGERLSISMYDPKGKGKKYINTLYLMTDISKHCLERIIERLNLKSVDAALDEMLSGLQYMVSSFREIGARLDKDKSVSFNRHVPTKNGALLLTTHTEHGMANNTLVTWIHKKQFFKNQEVTNEEFNFVAKVNYDLATNDKDSLVDDYREHVANSMAKAIDDPNSKLVGSFIVSNGFKYPAENLISSIEKGEYLDFMIDFEKFKH